MTDWIGDDGFLRGMHVELRRFNYVSDVTYCYGTVVDKFERDGQYLVRCTVWGEDQRGRKTCEGCPKRRFPRASLATFAWGSSRPTSQRPGTGRSLVLSLTWVRLRGLSRSCVGDLTLPFSNAWTGLG